LAQAGAAAKAKAAIQPNLCNENFMFNSSLLSSHYGAAVRAQTNLLYFRILLN
jgi:hypothetical protein